MTRNARSYHLSFLDELLLFCITLVSAAATGLFGLAELTLIRSEHLGAVALGMLLIGFHSLVATGGLVTIFYAIRDLHRVMRGKAPKQFTPKSVIAVRRKPRLPAKALVAFIVATPLFPLAIYLYVELAERCPELNAAFKEPVAMEPRGHHADVEAAARAVVGSSLPRFGPRVRVSM